LNKNDVITEMKKKRSLLKLLKSPTSQISSGYSNSLNSLNFPKKDQNKLKSEISNVENLNYSYYNFISNERDFSSSVKNDVITRMFKNLNSKNSSSSLHGSNIEKFIIITIIITTTIVAFLTHLQKRVTMNY
jgi:hypothetical protein